MTIFSQTFLKDFLTDFYDRFFDRFFGRFLWQIFRQFSNTSKRVILPKRLRTTVIIYNNVRQLDITKIYTKNYYFNKRMRIYLVIVTVKKTNWGCHRAFHIFINHLKTHKLSAPVRRAPIISFLLMITVNSKKDDGYVQPLLLLPSCILVLDIPLL